MNYTEEDWALDEEGLEEFYDEEDYYYDDSLEEDEWDERVDGDYHDEDSEYHKYNTDI